MIRKAFKMKVFPEKIEEYVKRHNPIWEDLKSLLKDHGVHNYSIFLDKETHCLFGYAEIDSEEKWQQIAYTEICQKWWVSMSNLMATNPDNSPLSLDLDEVFHMS
ncbi:L-rhamnose mutarotase [Changchengzhania lutea]|uniref:L-rhamnose mutarotase n=1 Tax=Changchengzhania lutea TaxID=2049305 RepID=UPI00115EEF8B|nr:L-rhamnose mutarotase [Changchengzhania lutea]